MKNNYNTVKLPSFLTHFKSGRFCFHSRLSCEDDEVSHRLSSLCTVFNISKKDLKIRLSFDLPENSFKIMLMVQCPCNRVNGVSVCQSALPSLVSALRHFSGAGGITVLHTSLLQESSFWLLQIVLQIVTGLRMFNLRQWCCTQKLLGLPGYTKYQFIYNVALTN